MYLRRVCVLNIEFLLFFGLLWRRDANKHNNRYTSELKTFFKKLLFSHALQYYCIVPIVSHCTSLPFTYLSMFGYAPRTEAQVCGRLSHPIIGGKW